MKFTVILNGCSDNFILQAEEINGFLSSNALNLSRGHTIIFYCEENSKIELMANAPTASVELIKVKRYQPENILEILKQRTINQQMDLYLFASDFTGSELSVRFAYRIAGSSLVAVNKLEIEKDGLIAYKAVYSNHMQGVFKLSKKPYCISIAKGCTDLEAVLEKNHEAITEDMMDVVKDDFIKEYDFVEEERVSGLAHAKFMLVAGNGVKQKEKVKRLEEIAKSLGAVLGVSRPVATNAWAPLNQLVGVSGVMAKPELCIAVAVSGAAAFFAGIEKSQYIIAINTDKGAPIVRCADVVIIDDYESILEELLKIK